MNLQKINHRSLLNDYKIVKLKHVIDKNPKNTEQIVILLQKGKQYITN